jgi:hypothetical protein
MNSANNSATLLERLGPSGYAVTFAAVVMACLALGASISMLLATSHHAIAPVQIMRTGNLFGTGAIVGWYQFDVRLVDRNLHSPMTYHSHTA